MKKIIILVIIVAIIATPIIWYMMGLTPVDTKAEDEIEVTIPLGTGTGGIADILKEKDVIKNEVVFKLYTKINNIENFQAGTYYLKKSFALKEIIEMLQTGKVESENQIKITYIEGKTIVWLANLISEKTNNSKEDVFNLLKDKEYINSVIEKYWFVADEIKSDKIYYPLEGYLFPDTYILENKDVGVKEIFEKMLNQMENVLSEYKSKIETGSYNAHEILTIASIIERESLNNSSRKEVSSVIYNRLKKSMAIQSDVTTYYAFKIEMGERDLYQKEIETYNPYNTRGPNMQGKLPIGPISSVSKSSIEAAIYPSDTEYLFFVADKNGKIYLSKTNSEHEQIIKDLKSKGLWLEY